MDSEYTTLCVKVQSARDLYSVHPLNSFKQEHPPPVFIRVRVGRSDQQTKAAPGGIGEIKWEEKPFSFALAGGDSLNVEVFHNDHGAKALGKVTIDEIESTEKEFPLKASDGEPAGWVTLEIARNCAATTFPVQTAENGIESSPILLLEADTTPDAIMDLEGPFRPLLSNIHGVMELVDPLAEAHTIAKVACRIVSTIYKTFRAQVEQDAKVSALLRCINEVYSYIKSLHGLTSGPELHQVILELLKSTISCVYFVQEYCRISLAAVARATSKPLTECDRMREEYQSLFTSVRTRFAPLGSIGGAVTIRNLEAVLKAFRLDNALKIGRVAADVNVINTLQKLGHLDMDTSQRPRCLQGTRSDHIAAISEWVTCMGEDNVLWISGVAGAGKSTLVNTIADIYREIHRLGAHIHFNRNHLLYSQPSHAVRTIAYQLARLDSRLGAAISSIAERDSQTLSCQQLSAQFDTLIAETVQGIGSLEDEGPIVVIIDALDECGTARDRAPLVRVLSEKISRMPPSFRFIITSRPERDLEVAFRYNKFVRHHPLDINTAKSKDDVALFMRTRMPDLQRLEQPNWPGEERVQRLITLAAGWFLWGSTACAILEEYPTDECLDNLLHIAAPTTLTKLETVYASALDLAGDLKHDFARDCSSILGLISAVREPLSGPAIDGVLQLPGISVQITQGLKPLLRWSKAEPIRPHHTSLVDYLTNRDSCGGKPWFIDLASNNHVLANLCIDLLGRGLKENMLELTLGPAESMSMEESLPTRPEALLPEETAYACISWIHHVCMVLNGSDKQILNDTISRFLRLHLLHWIEAMSILRQSRSCIVLLSKLFHWMPRDSESSELVREATRFCQQFANEIEEHPLLVYHCALPFTPTESIIHHSFDSRHHITHGDSHWSPLLWTSEFIPFAAMAIAFAADGKYLAAAGDKGIRVWNVLSGAKRLHISSPEIYFSVAFSVDGETLISGDNHGQLHIWDMWTGERLQMIVAHSDQIETIAISPSTEYDYIASVGGGRIRLGRPDGSAILGLPVTERNDVVNFALSSDGYKIVTLHEDGSIHRWRLPEGAEIGPSIPGPGHDGSVSGVYMAGCPRVHFVCSDTRVLSLIDRHLCIWDVTTGERLQRHWAMSVITAASNATPYFFSSPYIEICVFNGLEDRPVCEIGGRTDALRSLSISPDGRTLASGGYGGSVRLWSIADFTPQSSVWWLRRGCEAVAISPDGTLIATLSGTGYDSTVQFWDTETTRCSTVHRHWSPRLAGRRNWIRFSVDGSQIAGGSILESGVPLLQGRALDLRTREEFELDGSLDDSNWSTEERGDWTESGGWIQYRGAYITKLPFDGHLCVRRTIAVFVEKLTTRVHILRLSDFHAE